MKIITHATSAAASLQVQDEYMPSVLPHPADIIEALKVRYRFQNFPIVPPGAQVPDPHVYGSGVMQSPDGSKIGIGSLIMGSNGDIAQALTTDQAEAVLDDVATFMDDNFGFHVKESEKRRFYVSNIVVEFDRSLEGAVSGLSEISQIVSRYRGSAAKSFSLKRLAFGVPVTFNLLHDQMAALENADFLIEKRAGAEDTPNRFYCSAPLKSTAHVELLHELEHRFSRA